MKRFLKALAMAAGYFAVFLGVQMWITVTYIFFFLAKLITSEGIRLFSGTDRFLELYMTGITQNLTGIILLSNLMTILGFWAFFALREKSFLREIGLTRISGRNAVLSVLFGVGVCYTVGLITEFVPVPENAMEEFVSAHGMLSQGSAVTAMLSVALVGPVSEEICFRGLCYTRLKTGMRPLLAGLISGILFGLAHGNLVWFLVAMLAGFAMAWVFETTGSLWAAILVHITNNTLSQLTAYFPAGPVVDGILVSVGVVLVILCGYLLRKGNPRPQGMVPWNQAE